MRYLYLNCPLAACVWAFGAPPFPLNIGRWTSHLPALLPTSATTATNVLAQVCSLSQITNQPSSWTSLCTQLCPRRLKPSLQAPHPIHPQDISQIHYPSASPSKSHTYSQTYTHSHRKNNITMTTPPKSPPTHPADADANTAPCLPSPLNGTRAPPNSVASSVAGTPVCSPPLRPTTITTTTSNEDWTAPEKKVGGGGGGGGGGDGDEEVGEVGDTGDAAGGGGGGGG